MVAPPIEKWPIEPSTFYVVFYYPNNAVGTSPTIIDYTMRAYPAAEARAKELITAAGNVGICAINPITSTIVYPSIPWVNF